MQKQNHQRGLSLIELMVTLAISSLLLLGIAQLYLDNKRNHAFQYNQTINLDNSRFASMTLDEAISRAGYRRSANTALDSVLQFRSATADCQAFKAGSVFTALANNNEDGFCMRYEPAFSGELDCQGEASNLTAAENKAFAPIPENKQIVLAFKHDINKSTLVCKSLNNSNPAFVDLIDGVSDFRVFFGVNGSQLIDKKSIVGYVVTNDWSQNTDGYARAVSYSILLASRPRQRDGDSAIFQQWLSLADSGTKARLQAADNGQLYQLSSNSQIARNLMP